MKEQNVVSDYLGLYLSHLELGFLEHGMVLRDLSDFSFIPLLSLV